MKKYLAKSNDILLSCFAITAAAGTYFCMYAFRKPITAFTFDGVSLGLGLNIAFKDALIISQILGYTISKFYGIKFVSETLKGSRAKSILLLILFSFLALVCFSQIENPIGRLIAIFFNGLPLGMIWGLVFAYLEGRKLTDLMGAGLSVSFIFASGIMKSIAKAIESNWDISTFSVPYIVALIFIIPLVFFVWMLEQIPDPTAEDIALRTDRKPMMKEERKSFVQKYKFGIILSVIVYVFLSLLRSIRDDYAADIWKALNMDGDASIFMKTETPIGMFMLLIVGSMFLIRNNRKALLYNYALVFVGFLLCLLATICFELAWISPFHWMIFVGLGLYLGYIPFNCIIFERMVAAFKTPGTAGFLIYLADAWAYAAVVLSLIYKNIANIESLDWSIIFKWMVYLLCGLGLLFSFFSILYFRKKTKAIEREVSPSIPISYQ